MITLSGTYPVNDGDPQNDVGELDDDYEPIEREPLDQAEIDAINERNADYLDARDNNYEKGR